MKHCHGFYSKYDVLLLFEKFRNDNLKNYGLCPSHYLSICSESSRLQSMWDN